MKWFLAVLLAACLAGCNSSADTAQAPETPSPSANAAPQTVGQPTASGGQTTTAQTGNGGGIAPMGSVAVPNAPVSGTDSVTGEGGGGVQQAAKDQAKRAAEKASAGSASQGTETGE